MSKNRILERGRLTLAMEQKGLAELEKTLGTDFVKAVELIFSMKGRVIISGMGKSGHIGRKIAASLASTGTPAQFVHPAEASHGDLGMIREEDAIIALSWSGETPELSDIIAYGRRFSIPLIAITSQKDSALGKAASIILPLPKAEEACPHKIAPTTSTTMQLAMGDAISMALMEKRGFSPSNFRAFHPGGKLGASLSYVCDIMHKGEHIPLMDEHNTMDKVLLTITEKGFGCLGIIDAKGTLCGIITDGDLRRAMGEGLLEKQAKAVMTKNPKTIAPNALASSALLTMQENEIQGLFVTENNKPIGFLHMLDLLRIGVA